MLFPLAMVGTPSLAQAAARNAEAFRGAIVRHDPSYFERTFASDYVQVSEGGRIDRAAALAALRKGLLRAPIRGLSVRVVRVGAEGKGYAATLAFRGTMAATLQGRPARLVATWRDDQRWTPVGGRWTLRSSRTYGFARTIE